MLMKIVQLPGAEAYELQMVIHTSTANTDISLARDFQKSISYSTRAHILLDNGKERKCDSKYKWNGHEYHVQESRYVPHIPVKTSCATT